MSQKCLNTAQHVLNATQTTQHLHFHFMFYLRYCILKLVVYSLNVLLTLEMHTMELLLR